MKIDEYMGFKLSYTGSRCVPGFRKRKCNNVLPDCGELFFPYSEQLLSKK